jgi:hypothetical protein
MMLDHRYVRTRDATQRRVATGRRKALRHGQRLTMRQNLLLCIGLVEIVASEAGRPNTRSRRWRFAKVIVSVRDRDGHD